MRRIIRRLSRYAETIKKRFLPIIFDGFGVEEMSDINTTRLSDEITNN